MSLRYFKVTDPGSWINVDRDTGELRVANTIDRESPLVHDGFYNITVRAVDASKFFVGTSVLMKKTQPSTIHKWSFLYSILYYLMDICQIV